MKTYDDVVASFRNQLVAFNAKKLIEAKEKANLSYAVIKRMMIYRDNKTVYEFVKILRDKYVLMLPSPS